MSNITSLQIGNNKLLNIDPFLPKKNSVVLNLTDNSTSADFVYYSEIMPHDGYVQWEVVNGQLVNIDYQTDFKFNAYMTIFDGNTDTKIAQRSLPSAWNGFCSGLYIKKGYRVKLCISKYNATQLTKNILTLYYD